ncbi:MAG: DUF3857 domain-containing protein [Pontiellaceae bacterium]|nr:DUF3857 domain-containing protein [Pontiellaceae bacterium]MBN2783519.1 DUF3857 domain-containing protein [Pontiellaceae bacterium]
MKIRLTLLLQLTSLICLITDAPLWADGVSREPPPQYAEFLETELTPLDPLKDQVGYFTPEESNHGCILQENMVYVDADGRIFEVYHNAFKALSNGDLDDIGTDLFTFRTDNSRIYLIRAETILPDGTVCPVPEEGIMLQAHQQDQDSMIFSGRKQLRLIYPQVSKGSVTHCIVLVERDGSRIPGQFMDRYSWARSWQTHLKRAVVILPERFEGRIRFAALGSGIPEDQKTQLASGWTRHEWVKKKLPVRKWEYLDGPLSQTGPVLFMTTLRDWNEFGAWYAGCIRESSEVNDAVRNVAKEWADGAEDEETIIRNLAFRVAHDIRYVSLEFGVGGLQPQPVATVLENRFGDCKDKANFLRVLLKEHGIESHVLLINTEHGGTVDKRCADYNDFNHAILLVKKSDGSTLICDPTVKYGWAGLLYPAIADRPALVVDEETSSADWIQTPEAGAGHLDYDLDIKLSDAGELSGWFSVKATGYYATSLSRRFEATERESLKYEVERYLDYFYDASSVIDYELERSEADVPGFHLKAYFIRPATGQSRLTVGWPSIKWLLPRLGEDKEVQREAFIWNGKVDVALKIGLPDSVVPTSRPDAWNIQSSGFLADGRWMVGEQQVTAHLHSDVSRTHIAPTEFTRLYNAVDATSHWLEEVVILGEGDASAALPREPIEGELGDEFVLMSSGEGQVELIDHLYPGNTRTAERRLALAKTKAWFPKDMDTQFECDIRLGWLAFSEEDYETSLKTARTALRDYGEAVDISKRGWGQYLEGLSLDQLGRKEDALELFAGLERNSEMNEYRRGYAAYQYGRMMRDDDPAVATEYYLKALEYTTYDEEWMLQHSYSYLLDHLPADAFAAFLDKLHELEPERAESMATWLARWGIDNVGEFQGMVYASDISAVLEHVGFADDTLDPSLLKQLNETAGRYDRYNVARNDLIEHLANHEYALWNPTPDKERTFDEYLSDIGSAIDEKDIERSSLLALWRVTHLEPEVEFPEWIWDAARMVDYLYRNDARDLEPLLACLFGLREYLPPEETGTIDLEFVRAESLLREGAPEAALGIYQALNDLELEPHWWKSLYARWAAALTQQGEVDKAIEVYGFARAGLKDDVEFLPLSIHGVYALLEQDRIEEALTWMHEIYAVCSVKDWKNDFVQHIEQWINLEEAGLLEPFWALHEAWMPAWDKASDACGLPDSGVTHQTLFYDYESAGREIGSAVVRQDKERVRDILEQMMICARWHPLGISEAQSMMSYLASQYPDAKDELYRCELALDSEIYQLNPTNRYACRVNTMEALLKLEEYDALADKAEQCYSDQVIDKDFDVYCRYGGLAVINLNRTGTDWMARMEALFEDAAYVTDPYAVNILSLLYRQEGLAEKEQDLLKRFLAEYKGDNEQMLSMLKGRQKALEELAEGNARLSLALNDWLAKYKPVWLDLFPDPELSRATVAEVSRKVLELLDDEEGPEYKNAVYLLHAALDERLDSMTREKAFYQFLIAATGPLRETHRNLDMLTFIARDDRFSSATREICASFAANMAMTLHVSGSMEQYLVPCSSGLELEKQLKKNKVLLSALCDLDGLSAVAISGWLDSVRASGAPLDRRMVYLVRRAFDELCGLGAIDLAEKQISKAGELKFESTSNGSSFALQLEWQQQVDRIKELLPLHAVLESFFMDTLKPDCAAPVYADVRFSHLTEPSDRKEVNRALLQFGAYDHSSMMFWGDLNDTEYQTGTYCVDASNLKPLLEQLLAACSTDYQYQAVMIAIGQLYDTDNPQCLAIVDEITNRLMQLPDLRKTHQYLLWQNYRNKVRAGDHERVLVNLQSDCKLPKSQVHGLLMTVLLLDDQQVALAEYLNGASPDLLLDDGHLVETMQAFRKCGRDSSFNLLRPKATESMHEWMARSVVSGDRFEIHNALMLAEILDAEDLLSEQWQEQVRSVANRDNRDYLDMLLCHAKSDWVGLEKSSRSLAACSPLHYDTYFYLGKALIRQEKYSEGLKAIEPFLLYCKDSLEYEEALSLKKEAETR